MSAAMLTVVRDIPVGTVPAPGLTITHRELKRWVLSGRIVRHLLRYEEAQFLTERLDMMPKPFLTALTLRLMTRGACEFEDRQGDRLTMSAPVLAALAWRFARDAVRAPALMRRIRREMGDLEGRIRLPGRPLHLERTPAYLRTDLVYGLRAGGSVAHITGVLNCLDAFAGRPVLLTTDRIPGIRPELDVEIVRPAPEFWDFQELPFWSAGVGFAREAASRLQGRSLAFVYQRYSLNNYAGVALSLRAQVPLVMEYNGSEIWITRHWGNGEPLKYEGLSERAEMLCLRAADVVVVVSAPLRDGLVSRGIEREKILVNPNGVDPERFSPIVDGSAVRLRHALAGKLVIGFIGTFGRWHGAEVLADAFGRLVRAHPERRAQLRLLMVGDGVMMPEVKQRLAEAGVGDLCVLPGVVPQLDAPRYLAACDLLVSPHVPNQDGTPFFGSPTKLFEYMAMGKGIVASDLGQIGEVLEHGKTAWLVRPGDAAALVGGLQTLIDQPSLGAALGEAARRTVLARYTWREHTRRIVDILVRRCG